MKSSSAKFSIPNTILKFHFKQLLQDIESSETSDYTNFVLSDAPLIDYYGEIGSNSRKDFRQLISRLKRRPPSKYLSILKQADVTPSAKTYSLVQLEFAAQHKDTMAGKLDNDSVDFSFDDGEDNVPSDYEEEEEEHESMKLASNFENLSLKKKASPRRPFSHYTPTKTPIKKKFVLPTPPRSISTSVDYSSKQPIVTKYGIVENDFFFVQDGTKIYPYITLVDTKFPERNGGMFGFDISFVSDIQHNNFKRQAFKIRANTTPMDYEAYKMTIPFENEYAQFAGRCVLLKGPSRVFWHRENDIFENTTNQHLDDATKSAFQRDTFQINNDETRQHAYRLFIFPIGTFLDNNIFSGASNQVSVVRIPLKLNANHKANKFNKQMNEFELIWTIGVRGGEALTDSDVLQKVDYSTMF